MGGAVAGLRGWGWGTSLVPREIERQLLQGLYRQSHTCRWVGTKASSYIMGKNSSSPSTHPPTYLAMIAIIHLSTIYLPISVPVSSMHSGCPVTTSGIEPCPCSLAGAFSPISLSPSGMCPHTAGLQMQTQVAVGLLAQVPSAGFYPQLCLELPLAA